MSARGRNNVSNSEYDEALREALHKTGGFSASEIEGLLHIAKVDRMKWGYFDGGGLLPQIPQRINYP
ncbi:MAG: hypothetical protein ACSHXL_02200 [Bacteroidota bacterium]